MATDFISTRAWRNKRLKVLEQFHWECQRCLSRGCFEPAVLVHHDRDRDDYPELALSDTYLDEGGNIRQNLIPLCFQCHEDIERARGNRAGFKEVEPVTDERW